MGIVSAVRTQGSKNIDWPGALEKKLLGRQAGH